MSAKYAVCAIVLVQLVSWISAQGSGATADPSRVVFPDSEEKPRQSSGSSIPEAPPAEDSGAMPTRPTRGPHYSSTFPPLVHHSPKPVEVGSRFGSSDNDTNVTEAPQSDQKDASVSTVGSLCTVVYASVVVYFFR